MNNLQVFENPSFGEIRTTVINNEPWFVGKDIATALGYSNASKAVMVHVDDDDKRKEMLKADSQNGNVVTQTTLINESGIYSLVFGSKLRTAKEFKHWVTSEVLPTIRKNGGYLTPEKVKEALMDPDTIIQLAMQLKGERALRKKAETKAADAQKEIKKLEPEATYARHVLNSKDLITIGSIAKDYGMGAPTMNKLLHDMGIQYKQGGQWLLYRKYQDKGYVSSKTTVFVKKSGEEGTSVTTKWTQEGRLFLYEKLKEKGILPMIERKRAREEVKRHV